MQAFFLDPLAACSSYTYSTNDSKASRNGSLFSAPKEGDTWPFNIVIFRLNAHFYQLLSYGTFP
jgi:hypothetical protein